LLRHVADQLRVPAESTWWSCRHGSV
jgi:hypothetical protein